MLLYHGHGHALLKCLRTMFGVSHLPCASLLENDQLRVQSASLRDWEAEHSLRMLQLIAAHMLTESIR